MHLGTGVLFASAELTIRRTTTSHSRRAKFWKYGIDVEVREDKGSWKRFWLCCKCDPEKPEDAKRYDPGCSTNAINHLKREHHIDIRPKSSSNETDNEVAYYHPNRESVQEKLVLLVAVCHLSFNLVEQREFTDFVKELYPQYEVRTADTLKNWTTKYYAKFKDAVHAKIQVTATMMHIAFDGWTAPNGLALLGIVGTWYDKEAHLIRNVLLDMSDLGGHHGGKQMADCIGPVLESYGITGRKVGSFVSDNVTSNDRAVVELGEPADKRMRCLLHIINLIARAIVVAFETVDYDSIEFDGDDDGEFNLADSEIQAIKKLRTISVFIRNSSPTRAKWETDFPTMVKLDNATRWNSVLAMIESVLDRKTRVNQFLWEVKEEDPALNDKLPEMRDADWVSLRLLKDLLLPFGKYTMMFQGTQCWENLLTD